MPDEPTTVVVQRYLDALAGDTPGEPLIRELLERAVGRLRLLCATFLYKSYPRLTRPPVNLETDELLGDVVTRLLTALRTVRGRVARRAVKSAATTPPSNSSVSRFTGGRVSRG